MQFRHAIVRILGNENPPRDLPGSRINALKFILENEPNFPDSTKLFIINRVLDDDLRNQYKELLSKHGMSYGELGVSWNLLQQLKRDGYLTDDVLNLEIIGINTARNAGIAYAHLVADYAIVLDGDCIFDDAGWAQYTREVDLGHSSYFSIPTVRIKPEQYQHPVLSDTTEPMPVFHRDAEERFSTNIKFGECDKLELLFRLGHDRTVNGNHNLIHGHTTRSAGYVCHLQTGEDIVEQDLNERMRRRSESLQRLYAKVRYMLG